MEDTVLTAERTILETRQLVAGFDGKDVVKGVSLAVPEGKITAVMGPSGCGKTTFMRCINRMHELAANAHVNGEVLLDGEDVYKLNPILLRRRIGMVFQRPNPFPTMSIYDNAVAGLRFNGVRKKALLDEAAESSLIGAALWDSVKDRLKAHGSTLSGGEQQRLCIARALAVEPEVLLMDEPCSALDPISTSAIEETIVDLASEVTIALVTHNMFQATRCADLTAVFLLDDEDHIGELVEYGATQQIFSAPSDPRTEQYVTGQVS